MKVVELLDIGKMPTEWRLTNLGSICELLTDGSHTSPKPISSDCYMASVKDMRYNHFDFANCKTISKADFDLLVKNNCSPKHGDILLSKDGANCLDLIFVYKQPNEIVLLSSIAIARLKKGYNSDFYRYFLLAPNTQELMRNNFVSGSAIPRVILKDFKNVPVPLVDYNQQSAIAEVLSSLDDKIDLLHRQNKTLEQLAETLFRQWFVEEVEESWEREPLGKYVTIKRGGSPRPIHDYISETGLNWLKISDVTSVDSPFIFEIKEKIKEEGLNKTTFLNKGSLVLSNSATPGIPKILDVDSCIHDGWLHFPQSKFSKEFLYLLFKHIRPELLQMGNGSIFTNLKTDILKEYVLAIPAEKALTEFDEQVKTIFEKLYSNTTQIRTVTQLRDTLLPKLMSGEVKIIV